MKCFFKRGEKFQVDISEDYKLADRAGVELTIAPGGHC